MLICNQKSGKGCNYYGLDEQKNKRKNFLKKQKDKYQKDTKIMTALLLLFLSIIVAVALYKIL